MAGWWNNDSWYLIVHLSNVFWDEISRKKEQRKKKPQKPQDILFSDALNKRTLFKEEEEEEQYE